MDISMVYEEFDYYIYTTHKNKEIEKYLKYCRKGEDNDDIYDKFSYISEKCQSYGKLKKKLANNIIINDILESIWKLQFNLYTKLKNNLDIDHNGKLKKKLDSSITMGDKLKFNLYTALKDNLLDRK